MGTTGSTPAPTSGESRKTTSSKSNVRKPAVPIAPVKHSPAPKKGPKNYVDMGIEEDEDQFEQGQTLSK